MIYNRMGNPCVEFIKAQKNTKVMNIYKQIRL